MRVLVTGAAGFIGFSLTRKLLARGDEVIGLDCVNDYYDVSLKEARLAVLREEADAEALARSARHELDPGLWSWSGVIG